MDKKKKKMTTKKKAVLIIGIILLVVTALLCSGYGVTNHYLGKINKVSADNMDIVPPEDESFEIDVPENGDEAPVELEVLEPEDIQWPDMPSPKDEDTGDDTGDNSGDNADDSATDSATDIVNIMLVGQDRREGQGRQRSDTMILCSINTSTKEVSLISFLRDLYVQIPGDYSDNRLNASYAFGGFELLNEALYTNFGITVDGGIEVDFERFIEVIDALGGASIQLTAAEAEIVGDGATEGLNHLSGAQALTYARIRALDSDFNRTGRQRKIIESLLSKLKGLELSQLLSIADIVLPSLTTDLTNSEIITLMTKCFPVLSSAEINSYHVPADGTYSYASIRGMSVLVPDLELIREQLQNEYLPLGQ